MFKSLNSKLTVTLLALLSFAGGVVAVNVGAMDNTAFQHLLKSDRSWAIELGYISTTTIDSQPIMQADFLKMVMKEYGPKGHGVIVPPGVENHWAAATYATAKKEGIIDCSCQIKPDEKLTVSEAARFVWLSINRKAGTQVISLEEVEKWVADKEEDKKRTLDYGHSISLIRHLHDKLANLTGGTNNE